MGIRGSITKPRRRIKKAGTDRRRRVATQKKRLASLGVPEGSVDWSNYKQIRKLLKRPGRTKKQFAGKG